MNAKRLIIAIIAGFVLIFATDFLIHSVWLMRDYEATKALWRPETEMTKYVGWMFFAQFLCAATFAFIWAAGFAGRSVGAGAAFGLVMGLFQQIWAIVNYVVIPMPGALAAKWFISGLGQAVLLGMLVAAIYRPVVRRFQ
jgi:hypothetical protein